MPLYPKPFGTNVSHPLVDVFAPRRQCKMGRFYLIAGWQSLMALRGSPALCHAARQKPLILRRYFKTVDRPSRAPAETSGGGLDLARAGAARLWLDDSGIAKTEDHGNSTEIS
jgi:hypothetical protein